MRLLSGVLVGSASAAPRAAGLDSQEVAAATNILDTIGITRTATPERTTQIRGGYSFKGDEMPESGQWLHPDRTRSTTSRCGCPTRPGIKPNFASFTGKTYTLDPADHKAYPKLHFFGTTADGAGGGTFTLLYTDNTTAHGHRELRRLVRGRHGTGAHRDRPAQRPEHDHGLRRRAAARSSTSGRQPAADEAAPGLADAAGTNSGGNVRAYLMALTLEEPGGSFEMPDLDRASTRSRTTTPRRSPRPMSSVSPTAERLAHDRAADHAHGHRRDRRLGRRADPVPDQRRARRSSTRARST